LKKAGSVAHVLHFPLREAFKLPEWKLNVLNNEASRQRAVDVAYIGAIIGGKEAREALEQAMKVHGPYTEGYYDDEFNRLLEAAKNEQLSG